MLTDDDRRIGVLERLLSGQQMKGRRRERVLVGSAVDRLTHELLWRGVRDGSDGHVRRGQPARIIDAPGDSEVGQQDPLTAQSSSDSKMFDGLTSRCKSWRSWA